MFALPQYGETSDHLPIIPLQEYAEAILNLLILLYPTSLFKDLGAQAAIKLAKAYDKYLIPKDRLRLSVAPIYNSTSALESSALGLYRMTWELEMVAEAKIASRDTHGISFKDLHAELTLEPLGKLARKQAYVGWNHGWKDEMFFQEIMALRNKARRSVQVPYPENGVSAELFFGLSGGYPPTRMYHIISRGFSRLRLF
ncbi:hypothetical protein FRC00_001608 [Tulasnella sp. 408]|nr:hypothetical protein FRC00_001608 [Tulasnella sp. 408]